MPEVFTKENAKIKTSLARSGENNPRAKLKKENVIEIRRLFEKENKTIKEIHETFPQVSKDTSYRTWKNI